MHGTCKEAYGDFQRTGTRFMTVSTFLSHAELNWNIGTLWLITMPDPDISTFYLAMWLLISAHAPAKPEEGGMG
jgi:hypothetical protein